MQVLGGRAWKHTAGVLCFENDGHYIGGASDMTQWAYERTRYVDQETDEAYEEVALDAYREHIDASSETFTEIALEQEGAPLGSLVFRLATESAPATCAHFLSLLDHPDVPHSAPLLGTAMHRVAPGAFVQGGILAPEREQEWALGRYKARLAAVEQLAREAIGSACPLVTLDLFNLSIKLEREFAFKEAESAYESEGPAEDFAAQVAIAIKACNRALRVSNLPPLRLSVEGHCKSGLDRTEGFVLSLRRVETVKTDLLARVSTEDGPEPLLFAKGFGDQGLGEGRVRLRIMAPTEPQTETIATDEEIADFKSGKWASGMARSQQPSTTAASAPTKMLVTPDESYALSHDAVGVLGFANSGAHTVGTQIYVTFAEMRLLDRKYPAFGRLVDGLSTLRALEAAETRNEVPAKPITISAARLYAP
jgi:cyclophilin family peptidyl-prolyl cis-trans isomerase